VSLILIPFSPVHDFDGDFGLDRSNVRIADMCLTVFRDLESLLSLLFRAKPYERKAPSPRFDSMLMMMITTMMHEHFYELHGSRSRRKFRGDLIEDLFSFRELVEPSGFVADSIRPIVTDMTCMHSRFDCCP